MRCVVNLVVLLAIPKLTRIERTFRALVLNMFSRLLLAAKRASLFQQPGWRCFRGPAR